MKRILITLLALSCGIVASGKDYNPTPSPDSTMIAFTRGGDLWVRQVSDSTERRLTFDGSDLILNGYASWVYYEEVFGRPTRYRAFYWSPDSRSLAFFRFDNTLVPEFPIYSPFGQDGTLNLTRYPKAGECNPKVRLGFADPTGNKPLVWADFDYDASAEHYFGTPFWSDDSSGLYVQFEPRLQNELDLYRVNPSDGRKTSVYHEQYSTWIDFMEGMLFTPSGLYMVRDFQSGWQQIYFLSYDGTLKQLTTGQNWDVTLLKADPRKGNIWFTAKRDSRVHSTLYRLDRKGTITALTDPAGNVGRASVSDDFKTFTADISTARTERKHIGGKALAKGFEPFVESEPGEVEGPRPELVQITNDGFDLFALVTLPRNFDSTRKYPVVMQLYGGPGTPYVRDSWRAYTSSDRWCWENGIVYIVADPRSSGENGRRGMDEAYCRVTVTELGDYIAWAKYLGSLPYVDASRIGVEGFSFGGTTTSMLVLRYPEYFCCGIAGGGVYDWSLYDTIYTERFMRTPAANPEGYKVATVLSHVKGCALSKTAGLHNGTPALKLTHGTGDDNVHFQNTLQLIDALQTEGIQFDLMIYPDGMHGYRGSQAKHSDASDHLFWSRHLLQ